MNIRDNFSELILELKKINELEGVDDVQEVIRSCSIYVDAVNAMEAAISTQRFRLEPEDYRALIMELDGKRRIRHNSLIVNVKLLNRYCKLANVAPIYRGDIDCRISIAEFAMEVVEIFFKERRL